MKELYLEQILYAFCNGENAITKSNVPIVLKAMKEAVKQSLELAAENAKCEEIIILDSHKGYVVNKQSILNTINQVELK